jgi:hypothetical protein
LNFEVLRPLPILLFIIGGILGYGGRFIAEKVFNKKSFKAVMTIKTIGVIFVIAGMISIFIK